MNSLNSNAWKDLFIPTVSRKHVDIIDEMDEYVKRAETPDLFLKSTGKNRNLMDRSVFNFSYADIHQMMPEIPVDNEPLKLIEPEAPGDETEAVEEERTSSVSINLKGKRPKLLDKVCETLNYIFTDKPLNVSNFDMSDVEAELLKCVVAKKYGSDGGKSVRAEMGSVRDNELLQLIDELRRAFKTKKRKEEKIKFVFKHSLKNLKKAYFADHEQTPTTDAEAMFFSYYFAERAGSESVPIEHFFDPLNTSSTNNPRYKTLSKDYMQLLFRHRAFKQDFVKYISEMLLNDYQSKVSRKFKKLLKKLRKKIRSAGESAITGIIKDFISKFDENKRCKLPWTGAEITDAIRCFIEHIDSLSRDC